MNDSLYTRRMLARKEKNRNFSDNTIRSVNRLQLKWKHFLVFGILLIASTVQAQSSVTLYGVMSDGLLFANNVSGAHLTRLVNGGSWSTNFGMTGTEDLGSGTKAIFNLNSTYDLNTGRTAVTDTLFGGSSFVGITNDLYGKLTLGRQYDYSVDFIAYSVTSSNTLFAFHPGGYDRILGVSLANAVAYESPHIAGFHVKAMYSFGGAGSPTNARRAYSAAGDYANGPLKLEVFTTSVGGNSITPGLDAGLAKFLGRSLVADRSLVIALRKTDIYGAGGSCDIGNFTIRSNATKVFFTDLEGKNKSSISNLEASVLFKAQPDLFINTGFVHSYTTGANWNTYNLSADYLLSKRTDLMIAVNYQRASGSGQLASLVAVGNSSNSNQLAIFSGIRYFF
ncbi:porin [Paraburkholderia sediminicola]|uniref:Porin n=1 Tax=Paraburkholderia metrosideri TaxID=580937 RepID=A0ABW9DZR4_9BURK